MRGLDTLNRSLRLTVGQRDRIVALGCAAGLVITACGQEEQPGLGAGVAVPTTIVATTIVPTTTIATTTTSTVDFNRPITQATAPLANDIDQTDIAALVADIRGQTADVSDQMLRLAPFLDLGIAPVAQISGVDITLSPKEDGVHPSTATVRFRVPDTGPDMVKGITDQLVSLAWNPAGQTTSTDADGATVTESVFRKPGFEADEAQFTSTVTFGAAPTTVQLTSVVRSEDDDVTDEEGTTFYERLSSWQDPLAFTRIADLTEVGVETADDSGTVFSHYLISAEDETEAIDRLVQASARGDYELLDASSDEPPAGGPLRLVDDSGNLVIVEVSPAAGEKAFAVEASYVFELTPLD